MDISALRDRLDLIDQELIKLAGERQKIVAEIGRTKNQQGRALRDFKREKQVLDNVRRAALENNIEPALAETLLKALIEASLKTQEQNTVRVRGQGNGATALVIGGNGRMGAWFAKFLDSQGYLVEVADPSGAPAGFAHRVIWDAGKLDQQIIVVAAPLRSSAEILLSLAAIKPSGVILDIGSLKSPLKPGFDALRAAGCEVASLHPMFGPSTEVLAGKHVAYVDLGSAKALALAKSLFAATTAISVDLDVEQHDRLVAFVLGLSHALNIIFVTALADSGESLDALRALASTTFEKQLAIAEAVTGENPHLYFEIQSLNDNKNSTMETLVRASAELVASVQSNDETRFVALMQNAKRWIADSSK